MHQMSASQPIRCLVALVAACATLIASIAAQQPPTGPPQLPPTFRAGSTLVPLDVRVLSKDGRPITDLKQSDFILREDDVRQTVSHFAFESIEPTTIDGVERPVLFRNGDASVEPAKRRVILIMLGRGSLELPFKGITAAIDFVRSRLMPQDFVAVMAYNRATEFTTDHEQAARVLERFREGHDSLERRLQVTLGGLAGLYGNRRIPASMQADIDSMFEADGAAVRQVQNDPAQMDEQMRRDLRREMDDIIDRASNSQFIKDPRFDHFLKWIAPTMQDAGNVLAGIEYLRFIDGEKRLIFVTEEGFALPRTENDLKIAATASEARVAVDTIHTGGVVAVPVGESGLSNEVFRRMSALSTMKILSDDSGGFRSSTIRPEVAFARIDEVTRSQYVLGYYPSNPKRDGRFRTVAVTVNRPGATVHVRRGYYAADTPRSFEPKRVMTDARLTMAMAYAQPIADLKVSLKVSPARTPEGGAAIAVSGTIDPARLGWMQAPDGRRRIALELAILCMNDRGLLVGEHRQPLVLTMTPEVYEKAAKSGINYGLTVPVSTPPREVKAVVYDAAVDLIGTSIWRLR
jgi:VWFA-related protein